MSGGSYDYLFLKEGWECSFSSLSSFRQMRDRLQEFKRERAVSFMKEIRKHERQADRLADCIRKVWQAVEWYDSGDWSKEQMDKALDDFEQVGLTPQETLDD